MSTAGKESGWKKVRICGMIPSGCDLKQMAEVSMDKDWEKYLDKLEAYGLSEYLELFQKYLDSYNASMAGNNK